MVEVEVSAADDKKSAKEASQVTSREKCQSVTDKRDISVASCWWKLIRDVRWEGQLDC